jgi:hypothetical protein
MSSLSPYLLKKESQHPGGIIKGAILLINELISSILPPGSEMRSGNAPGDKETF